MSSLPGAPTRGSGRRSTRTSSASPAPSTPPPAPATVSTSCHGHTAAALPRLLSTSSMRAERPPRVQFSPCRHFSSPALSFFLWSFEVFSASPPLSLPLSLSLSYAAAPLALSPPGHTLLIVPIVRTSPPVLDVRSLLSSQRCACRRWFLRASPGIHPE